MYTGVLLAYQELTTEQLDSIRSDFAECAIDLDFEEGGLSRALSPEQVFAAYVLTIPLTQWMTGFMREHGRHAAESLRSAIASLLKRCRRESATSPDHFVLLRNGDNAGQTFLIPASNVPLAAWHLLEAITASKAPVLDVQVLTWDDDLETWISNNPQIS
jgi:hypothetical protein